MSAKEHFRRLDRLVFIRNLFMYLGLASFVPVLLTGPFFSVSPAGLQSIWKFLTVTGAFQGVFWLFSAVSVLAFVTGYALNRRLKNQYGVELDSEWDVDEHL